MIAVISGGTRGIGRAIAIKLAEAGYHLAIGARNKAELDEFKSALNNRFPEITVQVYPTDFGKPSETKAFAEQVLKTGNVAIVVNNVGVYIPGLISEETDEVFEQHLAVNLKSAWYLTRPFLSQMKERKQGHIFNICSTVSLHPRTEAASYSISKMALYGFHKVLCEEMREHKVKVTAILPGSVNTSSWNGIDAPKSEFIQPDDIANAVISALHAAPNTLVEEVYIRPVDRNL
jgi:short-subunit dehydrogenase